MYIAGMTKRKIINIALIYIIYIMDIIAIIA